LIADLESGNVLAYSASRDEEEVEIVERQFEQTGTTTLATEGLNVYGFRSDPSEEDQALVDTCLAEVGG